MCYKSNTNVRWTFQAMIFLPETITYLITKTLQSWSGPINHSYLHLFQRLFTRLRNYNKVDDVDIDFTSIQPFLYLKIPNKHKVVGLMV